MNDTLEDRIRDAYKAVDSWGPLSAPPLRRPARRRALRLRWIAPVAAAAAVGGVIVSATVFSSGPAKRAPAPSSSAIDAAAPAPPIPRFAVVKEGDDPLAFADVRETATGRVTAEIKLPVARVAGVGDGSTFFLAVSPNDDGAEFYRARLDGQGGVASLTKLPIPKVARGRIDSMTASGDGGTVAFDVQQGVLDSAQVSRSQPADLRVADVATGRTTTWRSGQGGPIFSMSMDRTGRWLAFLWDSMQARILDIRRAVMDLGEAATPVDLRAAGPIALSPNAETLTACEQDPSSRGGAMTYRLVSYQVWTGHVIGIPVRTNPNPPGGTGHGAAPFDVLQYDRSGRSLLLHGGGYPMSAFSNNKLHGFSDPANHDFASIGAW